MSATTSPPPRTRRHSPMAGAGLDPPAQRPCRRRNTRAIASDCHNARAHPASTSRRGNGLCHPPAMGGLPAALHPPWPLHRCGKADCGNRSGKHPRVDHGLTEATKDPQRIGRGGAAGRTRTSECHRRDLGILRPGCRPRPWRRRGRAPAGDAAWRAARDRSADHGSGDIRFPPCPRPAKQRRPHRGRASMCAPRAATSSPPSIRIRPAVRV